MRSFLHRFVSFIKKKSDPIGRLHSSWNKIIIQKIMKSQMNGWNEMSEYTYIIKRNPSDDMISQLELIISHDHIASDFPSIPSYFRWLLSLPSSSQYCRSPSSTQTIESSWVISTIIWPCHTNSYPPSEFLKYPSNSISIFSALKSLTSFHHHPDVISLPPVFLQFLFRNLH